MVNVIPGVNILTAPNADEQKVRSDVGVATAGSAAIGVPFGVVGGVVTGLVGNVVADEIRRGYARHVDGKTSTVAPAAGETLVTGVAAAAGRAYDAVKETLATKIEQSVGSAPSLAGVHTAKSPVKTEALKK